jgi:hypothetical protein
MNPEHIKNAATTEFEIPSCSGKGVISSYSIA